MGLPHAKAPSASARPIRARSTCSPGSTTELLPHFTSRLFNVGCDETFDLGQGKSKASVERQGARRRVYLDFLLKIHALVQSHGRTMMFWGDIIMHQPELIAELPKDIIAMEWGYEATIPFDKDGALFAKAGVPFYVCPGTSSWCTIAGRTDNCLANLRNAAENGLEARRHRLPQHRLGRQRPPAVPAGELSRLRGRGGAIPGTWRPIASLDLPRALTCMPSSTPPVSWANWPSTWAIPTAR